MQPPKPAPSALAALDDRARGIFKEIVESYLLTGEPVGSRTLSRVGATGLSPASIRNTMADLATLGLLDAPHAMAGRRPTHAGLRFFVDSLLQIGDLDPAEKAEIDAQIMAAGRAREDVLAAASDMLSGLAGGAAIVLTAQNEAAVRHVELTPISAGQALMVLVFDDGSVENRLLAIPPGMTPAALIEAGNFFTARFKDKTLAEAQSEAKASLEAERARLDAAAATLVESGLAEWAGSRPGEERALLVRGRANLLQEASAADDLERVRRLFEDLEKSKELIQLLEIARNSDAVRLFIGAENPLFSLSGSSVLVAPYMTSERRVLGALGVIGPTRLNYARVIPVVDYTARAVSRLLDNRG